MAPKFHDWTLIGVRNAIRLLLSGNGILTGTSGFKQLDVHNFSGLHVLRSTVNGDTADVFIGGLPQPNPFDLTEIRVRMVRIPNTRQWRIEEIPDATPIFREVLRRADAGGSSMNAPSTYRTRFVIMAGLPGTGKTALAEALSKRLGGIVLSKDKVRAALFPPGAISYSGGQNDFCMSVLLMAAQRIAADRALPFMFHRWAHLLAHLSCKAGRASCCCDRSRLEHSASALSGGARARAYQAGP